jgi:hypothetical protein
MLGRRLNLSLSINSAFIAEWNPRYEKTEKDQPEYEAILTVVAAELRKESTLTRQTFTRIINWKAARVKGKLNSDYEPYSKTFAKAHQSADVLNRISLLTQLDGIGVPVASTILHFMDPHAVPINDIRTVEVLHYAGLLKYLSRDEKRFAAFREALLNIRASSPDFTLRQIDRALFAYHKQFFEPQIKGIQPKLRACRRSAR